MSVLTTIARGDASHVAEPRRAIARTEGEWRALWATHAGPAADPPAVDLASVTVAAAFAGEKPSAGYSLEISAAAADPAEHADQVGGIVLAVEERGPGRGMVAAAIITSPFHIVAVPRGAGDVSWLEAHNLRASRRAPPASPSSTGLDPRTASALAYLAGPFSGVLILLAESTNPDVRFHAWQSIVGLGGLGLAVLASYALAIVVLFV
ncbi:MAG TPA: protease complex subunit PrcB family protein, partial [Vicinamibacterales bacterium]